MKNINFIVLLFLYFFQMLLCYSINNKDSLLNKINQSKGFEKYQPAFNLANVLYDEGKLNDAKIYYLKAVNYVDSSNSDGLRKLLECYNAAGWCEHQSGNFISAINFYKKNLDVASRLNDLAEISVAYSNLGQCYFYMADYQNSLNYLEKAFYIDRERNSEENISSDLNAIGKVYETWKRYDDAIKYYKLALQIDTKLKQLNKVAIRLSGIGTVYKSIGKLDSALFYQMQAFEIENKLNLSDKIAIRSDQIGEIYLEMKNYNEAEKYFSRSFSFFSKSNNYSSLTIVLNHLGKNYYFKENYTLAEKYLLQSLSIAENKNLKNYIQKNLYDISMLYRKKKDFEKSLDFYIQFTALKDSVFNEQTQRQLSEFQTKYETEKKEIENANLQKENKIKQLTLNKKQYQLYVVLSFTVLFIVIALLVLNLYLNKKKANALLVRKNEELAILNATKDKFFAVIAHDLKNPLSAFKRITGSIAINFDNTDLTQIRQSIFQLDENAKKLYNLLQNLLEWAKIQKNQIQISKQSFNIFDALNEAFLPTQSTAIQKNINVQFNFDKNALINSDLFAFTTIFRNLISNAVNYTKIGGTVIICLIIENNKNVIEIKDNGIGISEEDKCKLFRIDVDTSTIGTSNDKGSGLGLIITKELVDKINGMIEVDSEINVGSIFRVILPEK